MSNKDFRAAVAFGLKAEAWSDERKVRILVNICDYFAQFRFRIKCKKPNKSTVG